MSSEENEWTDRPDHPLLNNVILNLVFEHLTEKDLKECRLVCKTWNVLTIPHTSKAIRITIYENDSKKIHTIQKFVDDFRSNKLGIPFQRFKLGPFCTTDGAGQEFLKLCGDKAQEIHFLKDHHISHIIEDISELLKSTPTLKILEIPNLLYLKSRSGNVVKLFPDGLENSKSRLTSLKKLIVPFEFWSVFSGPKPMGPNKFCPTFLEELITAAQNISCLDMSSSSSTRSFEVLSLIEKLGREAAIQELRVSVYDEEDVDCAELLLRMTVKPNGLRLKRFVVCDSFNSKKNNFILLLIPHFSDTLEHLNLLMMSETRIPTFVEFPKMSKLTSLSMAGFPKDFQFMCVNFNEIFPVLRELELTQLKGQVNEEFFPDSMPCPNMSAFRLYKSSGMTMNGFNQMLSVFPNLKELRIPTSVDGVEILRRIWSNMTQLKSLSLYIRGEVQVTDSDSLDSVLTGISTQALQGMRDVVKNLERMTTDGERREMILSLRNQHQHSEIPSILNLTSLSSLDIKLTGQGVNGSQGQYLTDLSGYFGFYPMKRLQHLVVRNGELTKTCSEILRNDMRLESSAFPTSEWRYILSDSD